MKSIKNALLSVRHVMLGALVGYTSMASAAELNLANMPLFASTTQAPLVMLVMGRDHKLFYEAYNDASDLNYDGVLDIRYQPTIEYFGYFDSHKCYVYSTSDKRFNPTADTTDKTCSGTDEWSGDFLNYLSTTRMDALRKVLYGGYRSTDTASLTVLERSYIPQDAHSWAKTYDPDYDDYDIRQYTPLGRPNSGGRHLFANVTLTPSATDPDGTPPAGRPPLLRVLTNTTNLAQQWVSKERPVAGTNCQNGTCTSSPAGTSGSYALVPTSYFTSLTRTTYKTPTYTTFPNNAGEFSSLLTNYATTSNRCNSGSATQINGTGNPYTGSSNNNCTNDRYITVFSGTMVVPETGTYQFAVDGDDAVEFRLGGSVIASWYGGHGSGGASDSHSGSIELNAGTSYSIEFRHQEQSGGDNYYLYYKYIDTSGDYGTTSTLTDYEVRVKVCDSSSGLDLEDNCKAYGTSSKPTGLLHDYGENDTMHFGLMTGSYTKNTSGGVLRKKISSFTNEVNSSNGTFVSSVNGIVSTINKMRIYGFRGDSSYDYNSNCGWITTRAVNEGECRPWGNPIGEMIYETIRYFAGKAVATSAFTYTATDTSTDDYKLGMPLDTWENPYATHPKCCRPFQLVISDVYPSYDTDQIPGSPWASSSFSTDLTGAATGFPAAADTIWNNEMGGSRNVFIGESGSTLTSGPDPKSASSFSNIRGLSPEEPTKKGGYYSAAAAYWARTNDINPVDGVQNLDTFSIAMASPLPKIEIKIGSNTVSLVPFAKSVGGSSISTATNQFQPTNQIVDFYVDRIVNMPGYPTDENVNHGRAWGSFQINYEDVEQGADHDMDAIAQYTFEVNEDNTLTIKMDSLYAAGGIMQHMGYVISGTTNDGVYLEVRDLDTSSGSDPDYYLDTPPAVNPYHPSTNATAYDDNTALPTSATRTFTVGASTAATVLKDPLWYAAKWGGFTRPESSTDGATVPTTGQWDSDSNGYPDNYFLVTNALKLKEQIGDAFKEIIARSGSSSTVAVNSGSLSTDTLLFQAQFNSAGWYGDLIAYPIAADNRGGTIGTDTSAWKVDEKLEDQNYDTDRKIITYNGTQGIPFRWPSSISSLSSATLSSSQVNSLLSLSGLTDATARQNYGANLLNWLRGDTSNENTFRKREGHLLGSIVNSDPIYVGTPNRGYEDNWGTGAPENSVPYSDFVADSASRQPVVYVGSNDGMLHGFNASRTGGGNEMIAYIPSTSFSNLAYYASPDFEDTHRYLLDGSTAVEDVFYGSDWHTLLVGQTGAGGQLVYALDVTNPGSFNESIADDIFRWEFTDYDDGTHKGDADLGYTYGRAAIGRMQNGKWAVIVGNGYNNTKADGHASTTGNAVLFIIDAETGVLIKKIDTGRGTAQDPSTTVVADKRPNGMASPAPVDVDGDNIIDYVYAGDLFGNLWKFDVSSSNEASWGSAVTSGSTAAPFYSATTSAGRPQPITTRPEIGPHPSRSNCEPGATSRDCSVIIYFGTGKYFETGDNSTTGQDTQTFYALADRHTSSTPPSGRTDLQQQSITLETSLSANGTNYGIRLVSDNSVSWSSRKGWYMDLYYAGSNHGERQVTNALLRNGRIIFTTLIPSTDVCSYGGTGWLMELDAFSGGALSEVPYDLNNDGNYDEQDKTASGAVPAGVQASDGIPSAPAVLVRTGSGGGSGNNDELKATSKSTGAIETTGESSGRRNSGRQNWRLIQ